MCVHTHVGESSDILACVRAHVKVMVLTFKHVCVYTCRWGCWRPSMCVCTRVDEGADVLACVCGSQWTKLFCYSSPYFLRWGLSLNWSLPVSAGLAGQWATRIYSSLPSLLQCLITDVCPQVWFYVGARDLSSQPHTWVASTLPAEFSLQLECFYLLIFC